LCVEGRRRPWRGAAEEAKKRRCSARRSCGAQLGALHAGEAMQPPGPGREDGFATGQVVGAGFAVAIDEGLIALQGPTARRVPVTYSEARATAGASVVLVDVAVGLPSPLVTWNRKALPSSQGALANVPCSPTPAGSRSPSPFQRTRCCLPRVENRRLPPLHLFGAQSHGPFVRCLRFATPIAGTPRKTRFRLVAHGLSERVLVGRMNRRCCWFGGDRTSGRLSTQ
jgi:hypothetical protein